MQAPTCIKAGSEIIGDAVNITSATKVDREWEEKVWSALACDSDTIHCVFN